MITKLRKYYNQILRAVIIIATLGFLYYQVFVKKNITENLDKLPDIINGDFYFFLGITIVLMPVNWLLESIKWKFLIDKNEKISLFTAVKGVFAGVSISSLSPNRVGEFFGRIFVLKKTPPWSAVAITILGSIAQNLNTLFFGLNSVFLLLIYFVKKHELISLNYLVILYLFSLLVFVLIFILYLNIGKVGLWFKSLKNKYLKYIIVISKYTNRELVIAFLLSLFRFICFTSQFYFLNKALGIELGYFVSFGLISSIFILNTILPSIALLEVGIRGSISIAVFVYFYSTFMTGKYIPEMEIMISSSLLWFINLVVPAIIGLFFVKDLKFFKTKNK